MNWLQDPRVHGRGDEQEDKSKAGGEPRSGGWDEESERAERERLQYEPVIVIVPESQMK